MVFKALLTALVASTMVAAADPPPLDKPVLNPSFPGGGLISLAWGLTFKLPVTHSRRDTWGAGWIPEGCKWMAEFAKVNPADVEAFNVYYDDCPDSWVLCRHKDSLMSQEKLATMFGQLPVRMRDYVRHMIALPGGNSGQSFGQDFLIRGDVDLTVLVHEIGHNLDAYAYGPEFNVNNRFSSSPFWLSEYAKDSAVMDDYARKNHIENIAQVTVVALFDKVMPGGVGTVIPNSWQQVFHQYATVQWKLGDILIPGGTCRRRIVNSAPVATRRRRSLGPRPEVPPLSSSVQAIPEAPLPETVTVTLYDDAGNAFASETHTIPK